MTKRSVSTTSGVVGADEVIRVPLRAVVRNPHNPRAEVTADSPGVAELAASIDQVGLLEPIVVYPEDSNDPADRESWRYVLVAGERRLAALRSLPQDRPFWRQGVLAVVRPDLASGSAPTRAALIENLHRLDLSPMEEARAYHELKAAHGMTQADIAEAVSRNQGHVSKRLTLLRLLPELAARLEAGSLVLEHAVDAARLPKAAQEFVVAELNKGRTPDVAVREAARRAEAAVERGRLIRELKEAGVPVIDGAETPGPVQGATQVSTALWWLPAGAHDDCPKRLVWFRAEPQAWKSTPAERWAIEYCLATDPHAAHPRDVSADGDDAAEAPGAAPAASDHYSPAGRDYEQRRAEALARHEADAAAGAARETFMIGLLAGKLPKATADHLLRQGLVDVVAGAELYDASAATARARALLGRGERADDGSDIPAAIDEVCALADGKAGGDELARWALAVRFALDEAPLVRLDPYPGKAATAAHLRFLEAAGYQLSAREEEYLTAFGRTPLRAAAVDADLLEPDEEPHVTYAEEPEAAVDGYVPSPVTAAEIEAEEDLIAAGASGAAAADDPSDEELLLAARAEALELAKAGSETARSELAGIDRDLVAAGVDVDGLEQLPAHAVGPLPDDLHVLRRDALVDLARDRGVETTPKMTKLQIRAALEAAAG